MSGGEREYILRKLTDIKRSLEIVIGKLYKYTKDKEVLDVIEDIKKAVQALIKGKDD